MILNIGLEQSAHFPFTKQTPGKFAMGRQIDSPELFVGPSMWLCLKKKPGS